MEDLWRQPDKEVIFGKENWN